MPKPKQKSTKVRQKHWYPVLAPAIFSHSHLGETTVYETADMMGKVVKSNLMNLTQDIKAQNINMTFQIVDVKEKKGLTKTIGYTMMPASVKRMVRRRCDKVGLSFTCETADKCTVVIKPLLVTRSATTSVVKNRLRKTVLANVMRKVQKMKYDDLVSELVKHRFQSGLRSDMKKIFPLKTCEIRQMKLVEGLDGVKDAAPAPKAEAPKEAPAEKPVAKE